MRQPNLTPEDNACCVQYAKCWTPVGAIGAERKGNDPVGLLPRPGYHHRIKCPGNNCASLNYNTNLLFFLQNDDAVGSEFESGGTRPRMDPRVDSECRTRLWKS